MKKMINQKSGFSLMEMMVVLLIISIVAAATAPMVSKKLARNAAQSDNPWVYPNFGNNIAYNLSGDNRTAIIGAANYNGNDNPRLYIQSSDNHPSLSFGNGSNLIDFFVQPNNNSNLTFSIDARRYDETNTPTGMRISLSNVNIGGESVAIGLGQSVEISNISKKAVLIGTGATAAGDGGTAVGFESAVNNTGCTAIGQGAQAGNSDYEVKYKNPVGTTVTTSGINAIAIGNAAFAYAPGSVAVGAFSIVEQNNNNAKSTAIGYNARAYFANSTAIGADAQTTENNQIALGTEDDKVTILGNLQIGNNNGHGIDPENTYVIIGTNSSQSLDDYITSKSTMSDRRLKNVGDKFKGGLEELKKLDLYHFTFKKDEKKTPHVGVMAQDLQKIFPASVTKGEDGYLRIRKEDMFYAVINAVKELDAKISAIVEKVKVHTNKIQKLEETISEQQKTIAEQQKAISELKKNNADFEKRLAKLEKKIK